MSHCSLLSVHHKIFHWLSSSPSAANWSAGCNKMTILYSHRWRYKQLLRAATCSNRMKYLSQQCHMARKKVHIQLGAGGNKVGKWCTKRKAMKHDFYKQENLLETEPYLGQMVPWAHGDMGLPCFSLHPSPCNGGPGYNPEKLAKTGDACRWVLAQSRH